MDTKNILTEIINTLHQILTELIAGDCDTRKNLAEIQKEIEGLPDKYKLIDESGNSNIIPRG